MALNETGVESAMGEYQYYEFQAVDRPLTEREMEALRACSTRATITPTSFVNTYQWGNLKGNPATWVEKYFDAFLYVTNWGSHQLMLRLPKSFLPLQTAKRFCLGDAVTARSKCEFVILDFSSEDEDGSDWDEGNGWLAPLITLREELAQGDHRALYLAWLLCVQQGELEDDALEPPVPPGLGKLSGGLQTLCDFLRIDPNLVAVAAEGSSTAAETSSDLELANWLGKLTDAEKSAALATLLKSPKAPVRAQLLQRFRESRPASRGEAREGERSVAELLAGAEKRAEEQRCRQSEKAARARERREREESAAREAHLTALAKREPELWRKVETLIATKKPSDYDQAVALLKDLRDLGQRGSRSAEVEARLKSLQDLHAKKPSLLARMQKAGLIGAQP